MELKGIGKVVRDYIKLTGSNVSAFSKEMSLSRNNISSLVNHDKINKLEVFIKIAQKIGQPVFDLIQPEMNQIIQENVKNENSTVQIVNSDKDIKYWKERSEMLELRLKDKEELIQLLKLQLNK